MAPRRNWHGPFEQTASVELSERDYFPGDVEVRGRAPEQGSDLLNLEGYLALAVCKNFAGRWRCSDAEPFDQIEEMQSHFCAPPIADVPGWLVTQCTKYVAGGSGTGSGGRGRVKLRFYQRAPDTLVLRGEIQVGEMRYTNWPIREGTAERHFARSTARYWFPHRGVGDRCVQLLPVEQEYAVAGVDFVAEMRPRRCALQVGSEPRPRRPDAAYPRNVVDLDAELDRLRVLVPRLEGVYLLADEGPVRLPPDEAERCTGAETEHERSGAEK